MVGSTLGVYSFGLIFVSARTNKRHHHHWSGDLAVVLWRSRERVDLDQRSLLKTVGLPWNRLQRVAGGAEQVQGRQCSRERCLEVFRPVQEPSKPWQALEVRGAWRMRVHQVKLFTTPLAAALVSILILILKAIFASSKFLAQKFGPV